MDELQALLDWLLVLLPVAVGARCVYCLLAMAVDQEQAPNYRRRLRNALIFLALAECANGLTLVLTGYYN